MDKSIEFLNNNIEDNSVVTIGVSGGPDSMALLHLLLGIKKEKNLKIVVMHINHNLRKESIDEYKFVKEYCGKNDCIFEGTTFDKYETNSIENEARNKRYNFFEEIIKKYNSKYLLTAHHGDDLVETILMKLTRGSSMDGLVGIKKISKRDSYSILRPLIFYTKDDIYEYLEKNNIEYKIDESNFSKKYTRNRYRLDILPLLKSENNNIHNKYLKFSEELEENNRFVNDYVLKAYNRIVLDNVINIDLLLLEDIYIVKKVIYKYLFNIYNDNINLIESKHINEILDIINSQKPNLEISLPGDITIVKSYNRLYIKDINNEKEYKIEISKKTIFPQGEIVISDTTLTNNDVCHLKKEDIKLPLYVRNRKNGDYIEVLNLNGKKKVKDILIDSKVDKELRDNYPVVVDSDDNILWIPSLKKSKYDRLKDGNYDIILQYVKGGKNE